MSDKTQRIISIILGVICVIMITLVIIKYTSPHEPATVVFTPLEDGNAVFTQGGDRPDGTRN